MSRTKSKSHFNNNIGSSSDVVRMDSSQPEPIKITLTLQERISNEVTTALGPWVSQFKKKLPERLRNESLF
ncbi:MAG: hypothetical protein IPP74_02025 [Alphaproteobacteria bacterium]|nr:hypothetical protein [Alphaproteobacteria bacterium]